KDDLGDRQRAVVVAVADAHLRAARRCPKQRRAQSQRTIRHELRPTPDDPDLLPPRHERPAREIPRELQLGFEAAAESVKQKRKRWSESFDSLGAHSRHSQIDPTTHSWQGFAPPTDSDSGLYSERVLRCPAPRG